MIRKLNENSTITRKPHGKSYVREAVMGKDTYMQNLDDMIPKLESSIHGLQQRVQKAKSLKKQLALLMDTLDPRTNFNVQNPIKFGWVNELSEEEIDELYVKYNNVTTLIDEYKYFKEELERIVR